MPDIFDELAAGLVTQPRGDIFDELAATNRVSGKDVFDELAGANAVGTNAPPMQPVGPEMVFQPAPPTPGPMDYAKQAGGSFVRGAADVLAAVPEAAAIPRRWLLSKLLGQSPDNTQDPQAYLLQKAADAIRGTGKAVTPAPVASLEDSFWATKLPQGIGSTVGFMAGGAAGMGMKLPAAVGTMLMGAAAGGVEGFKDARSKGATDNQAMASFLLNAGVGLSEAVPVSTWLNRLNKASGGTLGKALLHAGAETLEEGLQEAFQSGAGDVIAANLVKYDPDRKMFDSMAQDAAAGGLTGFMFSLVTQALGRRGGGGGGGRRQGGQTTGGNDAIDQGAEGQVQTGDQPERGGVGAVVQGDGANREIAPGVVAGGAAAGVGDSVSAGGQGAAVAPFNPTLAQDLEDLRGAIGQVGAGLTAQQLAERFPGAFAEGQIQQPATKGGDTNAEREKERRKEGRQGLQGDEGNVPLSAPADQPAAESPSPVSPTVPTQSDIVGVPAQQIASETIALRPDLMQFKRSDDTATGVNAKDKLEGEWDPYKAGVLLLWEPNNPVQYGLEKGQRYIVANGHHRVEFGTRLKVKGYNSQILREADGYSAGDARRMAAEINIEDGKGTIYDQAKFIRNTAATHGADEALASARRIGAKGRKAATIALAASDPLFDSFVNEQISPEAAEAIAAAAPGNEAAQRIGIKSARAKRDPVFVGNLVRAAVLESGGQVGGRTQKVLFGEDDSAMQAMEATAERAGKYQRELQEKIAAISGAAKRPELAGKLGVDVTDPQSVQKKLAELRVEWTRWMNWPTHSDLVALARGEVAKPAVTLPSADVPSPFEVGDQQRIMGVDSTLAKTKTIGGMRYELFNGSKLKEKRAAIRVTDIDTGKVVTLKQHPTFDLAEKEYLQTVANAAKSEAATTAPPTEASVQAAVKKLRGKKGKAAGKAAAPSGELLGSATPFNLTSEKASPPPVKPAESTTGYGTQTAAQQEMFAIEKVVEGKDPVKSADAAQAMYGGPAKAIEVLRRQLDVVDSDKETRKAFVKEQRDRLKDVIALLEQRRAEAEKMAVPPVKPEYGARNMLVTKERKDELLKRLKKKLGGENVNAGLDPTIFTDLVQIGTYHFEAGTRAFADWSAQMLSDLGDQIRPYLESVYETIRHTFELSDPVGRQGDSQSSPANGAAGGTGNVGGLDRSGAGGRSVALPPPEARIVTARAEFTKPVGETIVPEAMLRHLDPHQRQGAAKAILAMQSRGGFLLADGTGVGKTRQALAVANFYAQAGRKVLIVTKAETIKPDWKKSSLAGSYAFDGKAMGVPVKLARDGKVESGQVGITTYDNLKSVAVNTTDDYVLILDECHALKNEDSQRAHAGLRAIERAQRVLFMSATPADKPLHIHYLARMGILEGKNFYEAFRSLGMKQIERETAGGKTIKIWTLDENVTPEERLRRFRALFNRMTEQGQMLKREISMQGVNVRVLGVKMPPEAHTLMQDIVEFFDVRSVEDAQGLLKARILMHQRRQQEPYKVASVVSLVQRELAAGRKVVIFASRVRESEVGKWKTQYFASGDVERVRKVLMSSEGTIPQIVAAIKEAGITDIAEIHGDADVKAPEAMAAFQGKKARVVVATIESGGTGINLDDTVGDAPRTMVVVTAPFSAVENVQAAGRIWRLKTKSDARVYYLFGDTEVDEWNADIIGSKMAQLGAVVEGQVRRLDVADPDLVAVEDFRAHMEGKEQEESAKPKVGPAFPAMDWKPFTTKAGKKRYVAPATKEFWDWWKANNGKDNKAGVSVSKWEDRWQVWSDSPVTNQGSPQSTMDESPPGDYTPDSRYDDVLARPAFTASEFLQTVSARTKNPFYRTLAKLLAQRGVAPKVQYVTHEALAKVLEQDRVPSTWHGFYHAPDNAIFLLPDSPDYERTFLHEMMHAATVGALQRDAAFRAEIDRIFMEATRLPGAMGKYGMSNLAEFLADAYADPDFQSFLEQPLPGQPKSLWRRLLEAIGRWLGLGGEKELTLLEQVMRATTPQIAPGTYEPTLGGYLFKGQGWAGGPQATPELAEDRQPPKLEHQVMGEVHTVNDREQNTPEALAAAMDYAEDVFKRAGVPVTRGERFDPRPHRNRMIPVLLVDSGFGNLDAEGRKLIEILRQELPTQFSPESLPPKMAALVSAVTINFQEGRLSDFSKDIQQGLYRMVRSDASHKGLMMNALSQFAIPADTFQQIGRNVEVVLEREWHAMFGGDSVQRLLDRILHVFNGSPDVDAVKRLTPEIEQAVERLIEANRRDEGGRVYRRVQALLKPKNPKKVSELEADARVQEAVAEILKQAKLQGFEPIKSPTKPLTPLQQLLLLVSPENAVKIDKLLANAVADAEYNAGMAILQKRLSEAEFEEAKAAREMPPEDAVEAGLELPEFKHWKAIRDNLLGYNPVTVKLAQDIVKGDFKGTRFKPATVKPPDERVDLDKLAKSPIEEVTRVVDEFVADVGKHADMGKATEETKLRVQQMVYEQVSKQLDAARKRFLDSFYATRRSYPTTASDRLKQLINAGVARDPRFKDGKTRELIKRVAGKYVDEKEVNALAKEPGPAKRAWIDARLAEIDKAEGFGAQPAETAEFLRAVTWTTLAERLGAAEERITRAFLKGADANWEPAPVDLEARERSLFEAEQKLEGLLNARAFDTATISELASKGAVSRLLPTFPELYQELFSTPFYRQEELKARFAALLTDRLKMDPARVDKAWEVFERAYGAKLEAARKRALKQVEESFKRPATPTDRDLFKYLKSIRRGWEVIERVVNVSGPDLHAVLRAVAASQGMSPPTEKEIRRMREIVEEEQRLRDLPARQLAEINLPGLSPEERERELAKARADRERFTRSERAQLKRELMAMWARLSRPLKFNPLTADFYRFRQNMAAAGNEWAAANILTRMTFATRQAIQVFTQAAINLPTRAIANAMIIGAGKPGGVWAEVWPQVSQNFRAQLNAIKPALLESRAAFMGRGEARNVDHLMQGMGTFDRMELRAKELAKEGKHAQAVMLTLATQLRLGYRIAMALDYLQGTPAQMADGVMRADAALAELGMPREQRKQAVDYVIGSAKADWISAVARVKALADKYGETLTDAQLNEKAAVFAQQMVYERMREMGLTLDLIGEIKDSGDLHRNTIGFNEREMWGPGGVVALVGHSMQETFALGGIPLPLGSFANAIGIQINRFLHFTPLYALTKFNLTQRYWEGKGEKPQDMPPWWATELDKQQRLVEASIGSSIGALMFIAVMTGLVKAQLRPPDDKEERDLWERQGHRAGTIEFANADGTFMAIGINTSPFAFVAPYIAAAGALADGQDKRRKAQDRLNAQAAKLGVEPGKVAPLGWSDSLAVIAEVFYATIMGGSRTAAGMMSTIMDQQRQPNIPKFLASQISPMVPLLPQYQEFSRMAGINLDSKLAGFADFMLPLPTSGARKLNMLGEPVGTPSAVQRIIQMMTGGTWLLPVRPKEAATQPAYAALFASGYRPPSVDPSRGYIIDGKLRPLAPAELERYTALRGEYFRDGLVGLGETEDPKAVAAVFKEANTRALAEVGATPIREYMTAEGGGTGGSGGGVTGGMGGGQSGAAFIGSPAAAGASRIALGGVGSVRGGQDSGPGLPARPGGQSAPVAGGVGAGRMRQKLPGVRLGRVVGAKIGRRTAPFSRPSSLRKVGSLGGKVRRVALGRARGRVGRPGRGFRGGGKAGAGRSLKSILPKFRGLA